MTEKSITFSAQINAPKVETAGVKVSLKNTFINVDDGSHGDLSMPDLLRAQTTPAVLNALQALYHSSGGNAGKFHQWENRMETLHEANSQHGSSEPEDVPPPAFDPEEVLRQLSELTETLSAMNAGDDGPASSREHSLSPSSQLASDPSISGTTVMLRNIPNKYTAEMLLDQFEHSNFNRRDIDFFYLPIDFRNKCNVGYAFINFHYHNRAVEFMNYFEGHRLPATNSNKVCTVCWARVQGRENNITHYRDSPILPEYRPWLFQADGKRESFPEPSDPSIIEAIAKSNKEAIRATNATKGPNDHKIFVGGLDKSIGGDELVGYFSKFGSVKDAAVVIDRTSGKSRGFGFCLFEKFVPRNICNMRHVINGCEVAVKMYSQHVQDGHISPQLGGVQPRRS
jgi:RNA recognition motif-containing protein